MKKVYTSILPYVGVKGSTFSYVLSSGLDFYFKRLPASENQIINVRIYPK